MRAAVELTEEMVRDGAEVTGRVEVTFDVALVVGARSALPEGASFLAVVAAVGRAALKPILVEPLVVGGLEGAGPVEVDLGVEGFGVASFEVAGFGATGLMDATFRVATFGAVTCGAATFWIALLGTVGLGAAAFGAKLIFAVTGAGAAFLNGDSLVGLVGFTSVFFTSTLMGRLKTMNN